MSSINASLTADKAADVAVSDWSDLFNAVVLRLDQEAQDAAMPAESREGLLACVIALDQLMHAAKLEFDRCARLQSDADFARGALVLARSELAGSQAVAARARHLAMHDGLTSLPNRLTFRSRLDDALSRREQASGSVAVLYLDLDGFKAINDRHGHEVGDQLLCIVAERLRRAVRADDLWARLGGDEFACLLTQVADRRQLSRLARTLVAAVAAPITLGALRLVIQPSIGIAMGVADALNTSALLALADAAMYRAKRAGAGYAFFDPAADRADAAVRPGSSRSLAAPQAASRSDQA